MSLNHLWAGTVAAPHLQKGDEELEPSAYIPVPSFILKSVPANAAFAVIASYDSFC